MSSQISEDAKLQTLTDHYKDTFQHIKGFLRLRDRLFLVTLALVGFQFFQISEPDASLKTATMFFEKYLGFKISVDTNSLNAVVWFTLLYVVIRYFQTNIHINRQYDYIHKIEGHFKKIFGEVIISREGTHYLSDYPWFSKWTDILYTWIFPGLLLVTGGQKIIKDWPGCENITQPYLLGFLFFLMIVFSTILYIGYLKFGLKKTKSD